MERFSRELLSLHMNGCVDIEEMKLKAFEFKESDFSEISALEHLFYCLPIKVIKIQGHECIAKGSYDIDKSKKHFNKLQIKQYLGEVELKHDGVSFGPQPNKLHNAHVKAYAMLEAPELYKSNFDDPKVLIDVCRKNNELHLLKKVMRPLPGMCDCTKSPVWEVFENIPIALISDLALFEDEDRYKLIILLR